MKTILEAIKAKDESAGGRTIAKALGGDSTIAEAISDYEGGEGDGGGDGGGGSDTYYTLSYDLMGYDDSGVGLYTSGGNTYSCLPATSHEAGAVVDLAEVSFPTGVTPPSSRSFGGWYMGGVEVTEVTMDADKVIQAYWVVGQ